MKKIIDEIFAAVGLLLLLIAILIAIFAAHTVAQVLVNLVFVAIIFTILAGAGEWIFGRDTKR